MTLLPTARARRLSLVVVIGTLLFGAAPGAARQAAPQALTMEGYPAAGAPAVVTLVTPGGEPRMALRYTVANTQTDHMSLSMLMSMSLEMAGMQMPAMKMPTLKVGADLAVTNVTPAGDVSYALTFTGLNVETTPDTNPAVTAAYQGLDAAYKTIKGSGTISNRGVPLAAKFDASQVTDPQLKQTLDSLSNTLQNLSMPLPEEPVGVGAKWEVRQAVSASGVQTFQKTVYEVVAESAKSVTLKSTIEQTAPPQPVTNPALPPGAEIRLQKLTGTGSGTITLPLDHLVPTSDVTMQSDMLMAISINGDAQTMTTSVTVKVGISPVK